MLIALVAAVVLAQAARPSAQAAAEPPAKAALPAKPEKPKRECHEETDTGSFISHRVCRTPKQADAEAAQTRREQDALADHLAACHGAPSC